MNFATWGHLMMSILPRYSSFTTFSSSLTATPDLFTNNTPRSTVKEHQISTPLPRLELTGAVRATREACGIESCPILVILQWCSSFQTQLWRGSGSSHRPRKQRHLCHHHGNKQNLTPHAWQHGEMKQWQMLSSDKLNSWTYLIRSYNDNVNKWTVITSSSTDTHQQHRRRWRSACSCSKVHTCTPSYIYCWRTETFSHLCFLILVSMSQGCRRTITSTSQFWAEDTSGR